MKALFLLVFCLLCGAAQGKERVDLVLVLAVDTSGSVDDEELALQLGGIAQAFRDPDVIAAALSGPHHRVAVNLMNWSDAEYSRFPLGWRLIDSEAAARAFADEAEKHTVRLSGATGIGRALAEGISLIEVSPYDAARRVIDVSGDGVEAWQYNIPEITLEDIPPLREFAGVTINGLAIRNDFQTLDSYYRSFVIGGPGAFVMDAADYSVFGAAMRRKLLRELTPLTAARDAPDAAPAR